MPTAHAHLDAGANKWAPMPHAHAHLGAGAPCVRTLGRQSPVPMHTSAPVLHAPARFAVAYIGMDFTTVLNDVFRLGKKEQSMPRHVAASRHKHSAICIGVDFHKFIGHVSLFPRTAHGPEMKWMAACSLDKLPPASAAVGKPVSLGTIRATL